MRQAVAIKTNIDHLLGRKDRRRVLPAFSKKMVEKIYRHPHILPSQPLYIIEETERGETVALDIEAQYEKNI